MDISKISLIIQQMNDKIMKQAKIKKEVAVAMEELAGVQKRIVTLERELRESEKEYSFLDEQLRPQIAEYLKSEQITFASDRILA